MDSLDLFAITRGTGHKFYGSLAVAVLDMVVDVVVT